jgi:hypothetical protein
LLVRAAARAADAVFWFVRAVATASPCPAETRSVFLEIKSLTVLATLVLRAVTWVTSWDASVTLRTSCAFTVVTPLLIDVTMVWLAASNCVASPEKDLTRPSKVSTCLEMSVRTP